MSKRIKADVRIEHPWLRRLFFLILIAMIAGAGWYYVDLHTIKDENVVVTGNVHYTAEEIKEMEFGTLPMMIVDTFAKAKNTSFFKVLSKLLS